MHPMILPVVLCLLDLLQGVVMLRRGNVWDALTWLFYAAAVITLGVAGWKR